MQNRVSVPAPAKFLTTGGVATARVSLPGVSSDRHQRPHCRFSSFRETQARWAKALIRREHQNSQNEPGMSAEINEIENRGEESKRAKGGSATGDRRRLRGAKG